MKLNIEKRGAIVYTISNGKGLKVSIKQNAYGNWGCFIGRIKVRHYWLEFDAKIWLEETGKLTAVQLRDKLKEIGK